MNGKAIVAALQNLDRRVRALESGATAHPPAVSPAPEVPQPDAGDPTKQPVAFPGTGPDGELLWPGT